jgi:hypothetical protein
MTTLGPFRSYYAEQVWTDQQLEEKQQVMTEYRGDKQSYILTISFVVYV